MHSWNRSFFSSAEVNRSIVGVEKLPRPIRSSLSLRSTCTLILGSKNDAEFKVVGTQSCMYFAAVTPIQVAAIIITLSSRTPTNQNHLHSPFSPLHQLESSSRLSHLIYRNDRYTFHSYELITIIFCLSPSFSPYHHHTSESSSMTLQSE